MDFLNRCYQKNPDFVSRKIADEFILVPVRRHSEEPGKIYVLNQSAAYIWDLIDGKQDITKIKEELLKDFATTVTEVEQHLTEFISQMETIGAIIPL